MAPLDIHIVTPDRHERRPDAAALNVPAEAGRLTVLTGHQPLVCSLREGDIRIDAADGQRETWKTGTGTLRVAQDDVTILARRAERVS